MTLNVYASLFEEDLDAVSDRLAAAISAAAAASVRPEAPAAGGRLPRSAATMQVDQVEMIGAPSRIRTCDTGFRNAAVRGIAGHFRRQESACQPLWPLHLPLVDAVSRHD